LAVRPWLVAFIEELARPSGVTAPWDLAPLILADSDLVSLDISKTSWCVGAESAKKSEFTARGAVGRKPGWFRTVIHFRCQAITELSWVKGAG
jgi:hypothetical protein